MNHKYYSWLWFCILTIAFLFGFTGLGKAPPSALPPTPDIPSTRLQFKASHVVAGDAVKYQFTLLNDTPAEVNGVTISIPASWHVIEYKIVGPATAKGNAGELFVVQKLLVGQKVVITIAALATMPVGNPVVCLGATTTYNKPAGTANSTACITVIKGE